MNYWRALIKFLAEAMGAVVLALGIFEWGIKLKISRWVIPDWIPYPDRIAPCYSGSYSVLGSPLWSKRQ